MLEGAIVSTKCALRDEFPEFMEFYRNKGWEPAKNEAPEAAEAASDAGVSESEEKTSSEENGSGSEAL